MSKEVKKNNTNSQRAKSNAQGSNKRASNVAPVAAKKENTVMKSITPYLLILLGLVFLVAFFTVQILQMDDGAGVIGGFIQKFWCGLFGASAFLVPLTFIYVGVKWCLFNIKENDGESEEAINSHRKRNLLQTVMACLLIVFLAALIGVFSDAHDGIEIVDFWEAGQELEGGGVIGGIIAALMVMGFESVISVIVIITILAFVVVFMIGLTPDRIIIYIREKNRVRREEREAEEDEQEELLAAAVKGDKKSQTAEQNKTSKPEKMPRGMSVDEMIYEEEGSGDADDSEDKVYIGPSAEFASRTANAKAEEGVSAQAKTNDGEDEAELIGEDFGGDPVFDNTEFAGISSIIDELKSEEEREAEDEGLDFEEIDLGEIGSDELLSDLAGVAPAEGVEEEIAEVAKPYVFPPIDMLVMNKNTQQNDFTQELQENAKILMDTLKSFKVSIREITYSRGPTITRYELKPEAGTRVRAIANLVDDIALNLATSGVRIEAPIPNKPAVGIEVPNRERATVYLRDLIDSPKFTDSKSRITSCLGMDVGGNPVYFDVGKMPHLLIAGTTGSGKSVCINTIILSILYKARPDEVKLILIDPKQVEFTVYENIPHLYCPIVSEPKKAAGALASAVAEMERRFELIKSVGVRNIEAYNEVTADDPEKEYMPKMVIIIDELADLMMTARDEVETSICRLAQKARAAGIHVILGTQRPSVDVITGLIKANIPSRIACTVTSQVDSRTIIDVAGAENLIGYGDMLFAPVGAAKPVRVQGAFVSDPEVEKIVTFIKENNSSVKYNKEFISSMEENAKLCGMSKKGANAGGGSNFDGGDGSDVQGGDSKFSEAVKLAIEEGKISTSLMQRRLGVGYGRAAKIIDTMEEMGYVSKPDGNKPRRVLITMEEYMRRIVNNELGGEE